MKNRFLGFLALALLAGPLSSQAATLHWAWSYSDGSTVDASGIFDTTDTLVNGAYTITGMSGTRNGAAITSLLPAGFYGAGCGNCWGLVSDNQLLSASPWLLVGGVSFTTAAGAYNLYYQNGSYFDLSLAALQAACPTSGSCSSATAPKGTAVRFGITAVPEPETLALFGISLLGLGFTRRRRN